MKNVVKSWLLYMLCIWISSLEQVEAAQFGTQKTLCPVSCLCKSNKRVECVKKSLKTVPNDLPISTVYLDISENKNIDIPETYFSNFSNLRYLNVKNCQLYKHFKLPKKLMAFVISNNKFSLKEFRAILLSSSHHLRSIYARFNNIYIKNRVPMFENAPFVREIYLVANTMPILYKETFTGLYKLKILDIRSMSIQSIEENAFADLVRLEKLDVGNNHLRSLPDNLFKPLKNLVSLGLSQCHFRKLPNLTGLPSHLLLLSLSENKIENITSIIGMGLLSIKHLWLQENNILRIPAKVFQTIAARKINLSKNKLQELESNGFTACKGFLLDLILYSNQIMYISPTAFKGLKDIRAVLLSGNKINKIYHETFKHMNIKYLLLDNNHISQLPALWNGTSKEPSTILLINNPVAQIPDPVSKNLVIYLSCDKLRQISGSVGRNSALKCVPSPDLVLKLPGSRRFFMESGYSCTYRKFTYADDLQACRPCPSGYFLEFGETCSKCPAGSFYQDQLAQLRCKQCTVGQYVPPENAPDISPLDCVTCPEGTRTNESAGFRACRCLNGFFRRHRFGNCLKCGTKGIQCEGDYQTLRPNFWWSWNYNRNSLKKYLAFVDNLKINSDSYDRHSSYFYGPIPKVHQCLSKGVCLGGIHAKCQKGYTGPLCTLCERGYYKHFNSCAKCPQIWIVFVQLLAYLLIFIFLCALVNWADKLVANDEERSLADVILSTLKIVIGFYQVLNGTLTSFSYIPWPETLNTAKNIFKYIELEIFRLPSLRCIRYSWKINAVTDFWIQLIGTLSVPCIIYIYYIVRKCILRRRCRTSWECIEKSRSCKQTLSRIILIFLFSTYPFTSKRILQLLPFSCHRICYDNASKYCVSFIKVDFSLECLAVSSRNWLLYVVYGCILIPLGLPILFLIRLFRFSSIQKHKNFYSVIDQCDGSHESQQFFEPEGEEIRHTRNYSVDSNDTTRFAMKFFYENYKPSYWYWEVIEMYRKLLLTSVLFLIRLFRFSSIQKHKNFYSVIDQCDGSHESQQFFEPEGEEIRHTRNYSVDSNDTTRFAMKFFYENYKPSYWYWEVIEMYRKLLLTSVLPILTSESRIFLGLSIMISSFFTVLHAHTKPIKDRFENDLQLISLSVIPANLCIGYILETIVNQDPETQRKSEDTMGISVLLLILNSLVILAVLARLMKLQIRKCKILLSRDQCGCRCCVACIFPCVTGRSVNFAV